MCSMWGMVSTGVGQVAGEAVKTPQDFEVECSHSLGLARSQVARENATSRGPEGKPETRPGWSSG